MAATATAAERAAVDGLLGPPAAPDSHVAFGGFHRAEALRHLLLPALQAVQGAIGWVSPGALNYVCERLIVPPADAYGVATFYALLATDERPARVAHVCDDIACVAAGAAPPPEGDAIHASPCLGQCEQGSAAFVQVAGEDDFVVAPASPAAVAAALAGERPTPDRLPSVRRQGRLLRRIGVVDPARRASFDEHGGFAALRKAREMGPQWVVGQVKASNLRGRGGAAFPTGIKWEGCAAEPAPRYFVVNADESEPGTFKDRILMEEDPFGLVEATAIAAYAVGASHAFVYVRGEYPRAADRLRAAIDQSADQLAGLTVELRMGGGAYICGEETALFNSIEGHRGEPRQKPPFPTQAGLFGRPTAINNVETLVNVLDIVTEGGEAFAAIGTDQSTGPKLFCVSGSVAKPGLYEVEFGTTLRELLDLAGAATGDLRAVLLGGAAGTFVDLDHLDVPLTFERMREIGAALGSGVVMAFDASVDMGAIVRRIAAFFRDESCGQCVPCRVGTVRQEEALARLLDGDGDRARNVALVEDIGRVMVDASICGLGQTAAGAVRSAIDLGLLNGSVS